MTNNRLADWLESLDMKKLRALASQRKLENWNTSSRDNLIGRLSTIPDIDIPMSA